MLELIYSTGCWDVQNDEFIFDLGLIEKKTIKMITRCLNIPLHWFLCQTMRSIKHTNCFSQKCHIVINLLWHIYNEMKLNLKHNQINSWTTFCCTCCEPNMDYVCVYCESEVYVMLCSKSTQSCNYTFLWEFVVVNFRGNTKINK